MDTAKFKQIVDSGERFVIIQAENPDMDSLGSALALESLLEELGKKTDLYCPTDIPRHLRYLEGWDRVTNEFPGKLDAAIIVDTSAKALLEKLILDPAINSALSRHPVLVIDHHNNAPDLPWPDTHYLMDPTAVSATQVLFAITKELEIAIDPITATAMAAGLLSDSLGFTSVKTTSDSLRMMAELVDAGVNPSKLDETRREAGKKTLSIIQYKGKLLQRIEYFLDSQLAVVTIPESEIKEHSDQYNPAMLVLEELRQAQGVRLSVVLKEYDRRITGKLRANDALVCDQLAANFGGGGHPFAAGFKTSDWKLDELKKELVKIADKLLKEFDANQNETS